MGRPYRRLRRWSRHTPNTEIALILIVVGVALLFLAFILAFTVV